MHHTGVFKLMFPSIGVFTCIVIQYQARVTSVFSVNYWCFFFTSSGKKIVHHFDRWEQWGWCTVMWSYSRAILSIIACRSAELSKKEISLEHVGVIADLDTTHLWSRIWLLGKAQIMGLCQISFSYKHFKNYLFWEETKACQIAGACIIMSTVSISLPARADVTRRQQEGEGRRESADWKGAARSYLH